MEFEIGDRVVVGCGVGVVRDLARRCIVEDRAGLRDEARVLVAIDDDDDLTVLVPAAVLRRWRD